MGPVKSRLAVIESAFRPVTGYPLPCTNCPDRMLDPLVSVLLPVFDAEDTVGEALTSLSTQVLEDFEIVVVDDGSGDASASLVATHARREPRLRLISAPHEGLIAALNRGL